MAWWLPLVEMAAQSAQNAQQQEANTWNSFAGASGSGGVQKQTDLAPLAKAVEGFLRRDTTPKSNHPNDGFNRANAQSAATAAGEASLWD